MSPLDDGPDTSARCGRATGWLVIRRPTVHSGSSKLPRLEVHAVWKNLYMGTLNGENSLSEILEGLSYPAERWQIIASAEIDGADEHTLRELDGLPARTFESVEDIVDALD